jgi:ComF family protein
VLAAVLDLLYPRRCAGCGDGAWPICPTCRAQLVLLLPPWCERCGRPAEEPLPSCPDCPPRPIDGARAPLLYRGPARAALHRLKFAGWRAVAGALGAAMASVNGFPADAITWVPLSRSRRSRRGYDQAAALATSVSSLLRVPSVCMLERTRDTPAQATRTGRERRKAMSGAFRWAARDPPPPRVLLVDDVLTTGATAAECARVLRSAGARRIHLLVAARALSGPLPARCYTAVDSRLSLWLPGDRPR